MTDQELLISTLREACLIIANYLEPGPRNADEVITQLIAVLDTQELANAIERIEGRGVCTENLTWGCRSQRKKSLVHE